MKESSLERKVRRHEVSFSSVQGENGSDYLKNYLFEHSGRDVVDMSEMMVRKVGKRVLQRALFGLPKEDREILSEYLVGVKQNEIAKRLNVSPSAINQ